MKAEIYTAEIKKLCKDTFDPNENLVHRKDK